MEQCLYIISQRLSKRERCVLREVCREFAWWIAVDGTVDVRKDGFYRFAKGIRLMNYVRVKDKVVAPYLEKLDLCSWRKKGFPSGLPLENVQSLILRDPINLSPFSCLKKVEFHDPTVDIVFLPATVNHMIIHMGGEFHLRVPVRRLEVYNVPSLHVVPSMVEDLETNSHVLHLVDDLSTSTLKKVVLSETTRIETWVKHAFQKVTFYKGPPKVNDRRISFSEAEEASFYFRGNNSRFPGVYPKLKKLSLKVFGEDGKLGRFRRVCLDGPLLEDVSVDANNIWIFGVLSPIKKLSVKLNTLDGLIITRFPVHLEKLSVEGPYDLYIKLLKKMETIQTLRFLQRPSSAMTCVELPRTVLVQKMEVVREVVPPNLEALFKTHPHMEVTCINSFGEVL